VKKHSKLIEKEQKQPAKEPVKSPAKISEETLMKSSDLYLNIKDEQ